MIRIFSVILILSTLSCGVNKETKLPYWHEKTDAQKKEYKKERRKENLKTMGITVATIGGLIIVHKSVSKLADDCKSCK